MCAEGMGNCVHAHRNRLQVIKNRCVLEGGVSIDGEYGRRRIALVTKRIGSAGFRGYGKLRAIRTIERE